MCNSPRHLNEDVDISNRLRLKIQFSVLPTRPKGFGTVSKVTGVLPQLPTYFLEVRTYRIHVVR